MLRSKFETPTNLKHIGVKEFLVVGASYIWWQRRELVKGEKVAAPERTSFAIQGLTLNYKAAMKEIPKDIHWSRPSPGIYKLNMDACFFPSGQVLLVL